MAFSFGFSGDDIEESEVGGAADQVEVLSLTETPDAIETIEVQTHSLTDLLSTLPSRISYSTTLLTSPKYNGRAIISRRALFDIRAQLMAEDSEDADIVTGLGDSDIEQNVYEGGFKSWEGATDLALLLLDHVSGMSGVEEGKPDHVIELGCGTALPSTVLLQHCLSDKLPLKLTLADYNSSVLRLVTLPNVLLLWALHFQADVFDPCPPTLSANHKDVYSPDGELELTPELLDAFETWLKKSNIEISFISGPWSSQLTQTIHPRPHENVLILAAETIYSPATTPAFTNTVLDMLRQARTGKALVAAKKVYFGVGGGVADFEHAVRIAEGRVRTMSGTGVVGADPDVTDGGGGVARWIGEVTI